MPNLRADGSLVITLGVLIPSTFLNPSSQLKLVISLGNKIISALELCKLEVQVLKKKDSNQGRLNLETNEPNTKPHGHTSTSTGKKRILLTSIDQL